MTTDWECPTGHEGCTNQSMHRFRVCLDEEVEMVRNVPPVGLFQMLSERTQTVARAIGEMQYNERTTPTGRRPGHIRVPTTEREEVRDYLRSQVQAMRADDMNSVAGPSYDPDSIETDYDDDGSISTRVNPFPGQQIRRVQNWKGYGGDEDRPKLTPEQLSTLESGDIVTSESIWPPDKHRLVLDIDMDCEVLPSSTPGHHHLFIDKTLDWDQYCKLLDVLAEVGIIESGYVKASKLRGYTAVRLPWVKKEKN